MSAAEQFDGHDDATGAGEAYDGAPTPGLSLAPDVVEVRRNSGVAAALGITASVVAIAWFARAIATGGLLDWVMVALVGAVAVTWLAGLADGRTPLMVADQQGVRARLGREWVGLPWSAVAHVEHRAPRGPLRDGVIDVVPHNPERFLAELTPAAARQARIASRLHGGPLALPMGWSTRVRGADDGVGPALAALGATEQVDLDEGTPVEAEEASLDVLVTAPEGRLGRVFPLVRRAAARSIHVVADRLPGRTAADEPVTTETAAEGEADVWDDVEPSPTPEPVRDVTTPIRSDVVLETSEADELLDPDETAEIVLDEAVDEGVEDSAATSWLARVRPIARESHPVEPLVIDDLALEPAHDPVIGPEIRAARTRIGLSTDELAERTRIRPHVIEAIEVDDFVPCGGDFYARGHLRTLARVLGIDAVPLLTTYDERYTGAPIDARRVFEAELAAGGHGAIRGVRGGPNWSVLVAAVMAAILCWSVAQLIMDAPAEVAGTPVLDGSGGPGGAAVVADPVAVTVTAPTSGAEIVVRDQAGKVVFKGRLAIGESHEVKAVAPVRVQSSDGSVTVDVAGTDRGPVGEAGSPAQGTYAARR